MRWIAEGCDAVVALGVARLLLRQIRGLLLDVGSVISACRDLVRMVRSAAAIRSGSRRHKH
jgi:hypothetical protein